MENEVAKVAGALPHSHVRIKVHRLMCTELMRFVDKTSQILPVVESARPRCTMGIQALCSVNSAIERAKSVIEHCTECSKLYLAITGEVILSRCEKVRKMLELSLTQIQNMVPLALAGQISAIIDNIRDAKFLMDPSEEEAGKAMLALLRRDPTASEPTKISEFETFKIAASKLQLTSAKALLIEKRSIKILLSKVCNTDQNKEKILKYLLYILKKYGKSVQSWQKDVCIVQPENSDTCAKSASNGAVCSESVELERHGQYGLDEAQTDAPRTPVPPEEFRCPISMKLMHDPVIIASGQTFEKMGIEKWFSEGHITCPKTKKELPNLSMTPNSIMKDLISKWSKGHGIPIPDPCSKSTPGSLSSWKSSSCSSIVSFGSSMNDVTFPMDVSGVSLNSSDASYTSDSSQVKIVDTSSSVATQMDSGFHGCQSSVNSNNWLGSVSLSKLAELPWESRRKVVEDVKNYFKEDGRAASYLYFEYSVQSLIRFIEDARSLLDVKAQRDGAQVLLALMSNCRDEIPSLSEHDFHLLVSFVDSEITKEALSIIEVLSDDQECRSKIMASGAILPILKILDTQISDFQVSAVKILCNLSLDREIGSHIQSLGCIPKLVPFLVDSALAECSIKLIRNLSNTEVGRVAIAETDGCIASMAELLEIGTHEEQEHGVAVLLSLCLQRTEYCLLVLREGIIPPLVNISNGNGRAKYSAVELLRILRDVTSSDSLGNSLPHPGAKVDFLQDSSESKEKKPSSKAPGFFRRKLKELSKSKPRSLALF